MTHLRQACIFIVATLLLSWSFEAFMIARGGVRNLGPVWLVALMCIPGSVAVALRCLLGTGFADMGLRLGQRRYYAYAVALPVLLALGSAALAALIDLRRLSPVTLDMLWQLSSLALTILALGILGAAGEELGWRGLLLPQLVASGIPHPYLATGLVWAIWHLPLIAWGAVYETDHALLMALVYAVGTLAINLLISELRMRSGSVWVAATLHAAHNFCFQFVVPALLLTVPGSRAAAWDLMSSDTGLNVAVLYAVAYWVMRRVGRGSERAIQDA